MPAAMTAQMRLTDKCVLIFVKLSLKLGDLQAVKSTVNRI